MTETKFKLMKEAFELVNSFRETYKLFENGLGTDSNLAKGAFDRYCGAQELFERLFAIDYYDARSIFEYFEVPF